MTDDNRPDLHQLPPGTLIFDNLDISGWVADAYAEITSNPDARIMKSRTHIILNPSARIDDQLFSMEDTSKIHHVKMTEHGKEFESRGIITRWSPGKIQLENVMLKMD